MCLYARLLTNAVSVPFYYLAISLSQFIIDNGGIHTEQDYPYTAMEGECLGNKLNRHVVTIDGFEDVPVNNEMALRKAVAHQVCVAATAHA